MCLRLAAVTDDWRLTHEGKVFIAMEVDLSLSSSHKYRNRPKEHKVVYSIIIRSIAIINNIISVIIIIVMIVMITSTAC